MKAICLTIVSMMLAGCGLSGGEMSGHVVDQSTGKPVPNALVYAAWYGNAEEGFNSRTICYHFSVTKADQNGKFVLPAWHNDSVGVVQSLLIDSRQRSMGVYAIGYVTNSVEQTRDGWLGGPLLKVKTDTRKASERVQAVFNVGDATCSNFDKASAKNLSTIFKATLKEAEKIASTQEDYSLIDIKKSEIEDADKQSR
jgi:5-hydroxyisourate hydrolase-like protein (transthyretin family)